MTFDCRRGACVFATAWLALAFPRPASAAEPDAVEVDVTLTRARSIVHAAERLFDAGHFEAALAEYSRAHATLEGHPKQYWVLYNLAACNERLFRYDVALGLYEDYLRRAPESEKDRAQVVAIMHSLRALLGTLVVESTVAGSVWVDGRLLGAAPGHWLVPAGSHIVELRAELYESQRQQLQFVAGRTHPVRFEPQRLSTYTGPPRGYFWATTALTGAAAVAGTTFGLMALSAHGDGSERAGYYFDTSADAERAQDLALAADISFGAAALFGTTAAVLYFVTDWSSPRERAAASTSRRIQVNAALASGARKGASATLRWEF